MIAYILSASSRVDTILILQMRLGFFTQLMLRIQLTQAQNQRPQGSLENGEGCGGLPSVSQLVFREHCPLSLSREDSCSSDRLSLPVLLQGDKRGDSPPQERLPPDRRLWV